jgi:BirA family biotin operon repressor/biotin-[acetyl-CoA-carboxylase] ligase
LGRDVSVDLGSESFVGRAVDVNVDGSLVVETSAGRRSVSAGDVVHVR